MESQTRGLREALGPKAVFVFLNGPFDARGPTDEVVERKFGETAPFFEWWATRELKKEEKEAIEGEEGVPNGTTKHWHLKFEDIDHAIEDMDKRLNELGEFDLAVGFSQGAAMLTILSTWCHKKGKKCWWKLVLCVCGVVPRAINVRELFETPEGTKILVPLPSIHVVGKKDSLYKESLLLKDTYMMHSKGSPLERRLIEHDGGHKFPSPELHHQLYMDLANTIWQFFNNIRQSSVARM
ncbi:hypothetical protein KXD40_004397 [Peronospora effusa]|uniref:Serine hydrolase domain-containing protein n=1 Tax=Peronospora effusa TaxID=542832 RepID=A0A3M6VMU2_9STRA|nr:hypothetical protein DD238_000149 [Peronospora effusa]RQM18152.1 hypothetical protein DD237_000209 [Peronospora effusa]UIZ28136.1 hypothetical protein KXD40_004397 [Peronospora effusa]